jgi:hypothetical protein
MSASAFNLKSYSEHGNAKSPRQNIREFGEYFANPMVAVSESMQIRLAQVARLLFSQLLLIWPQRKSAMGNNSLIEYQQLPRLK